MDQGLQVPHLPGQLQHREHGPHVDCQRLEPCHPSPYHASFITLVSSSLNLTVAALWKMMETSSVRILIPEEGGWKKKEDN